MPIPVVPPAAGSTCVVVIDIGGTKTRFCLLAEGVIVEDVRVATPRGSVDELLVLLEGGTRSLLERHRVSRFAVSVAMAGTLDASQQIVTAAANLPLAGVELGRRLGTALNAEVTLEEDANAGALGEARQGAGRGHRYVAYLTISTGIGMGLVLDDRVHRGAFGGAGEIGHVLVDPGVADRCACGRRGCLEQLASGQAIRRLAIEAGIIGPDDDARTVIELAEAGDAKACVIIDWTSTLVGRAIDTVARLVEPSIVVIGGGVGRSMFFFDRVAAALGEIPNIRGHRAPAVVPSALGEWSEIVGAHELVVPFRPVILPALHGALSGAVER